MNRDNAAIALDDTPTGDEFSAEERAYFESGGQSAPSAPKIEDSRLAQEPEADADADAEEIEVEDVEDDGDTPDEPLRDEKGRFVPKSAYLRVKEQAKSTNDKLAQVAAELIRMRERQAVLNEMATRQAPEQAPEADADIDPNEDIFGAYAALAKKYERLEQQFNGSNESLRDEITALRVDSLAKADYNAFAAKTPDFVDALQHLVQSMHKELESFGYTDEADRTQRIKAEANRVVRERILSGKSAAEVMWASALARGYKPKAAGDASPEIDQKAAEEIERINKGKKASVSLKGGGGASSSLENITVTKLAEMSEDDFSRTMRQYKAKYGESGWRKLMGG